MTDFDKMFFQIGKDELHAELEIQDLTGQPRDYGKAIFGALSAIVKADVERAKEDALIERWKRNTAIDCGARFPVDDEQQS